MTVTSKTIKVETKGELEMINITNCIETVVKESKINDGIATIFIPGSTASLTTIEYEPGLQRDFPNMLERIAPADITYEHDQMWHDGNGHSHVRASLVGPSLIVPFKDKKLTLGTWQQVVVIELDTRDRHRSVVVTLIGE